MLLAGLVQLAPAQSRATNFGELFCTKLETQGAVPDVPDGASALYVVYSVARAHVEGSVTIRDTPGDPPAFSSTLPDEVSTNPGFYIGVVRPGSPDPQLAYLVRLADPSYVVVEGQDRRLGETRGSIVRVQGTLATRVPFVQDGTLVACEVDENLDRTFHFNRTLGAKPPDSLEFQVKLP